MIYVPGRPARDDEIPGGARLFANQIRKVGGWEVWAIIYSAWQGQARRKQEGGTMPLVIVIGETVTVRLRSEALGQAGYQGWDRLDDGDWKSTGGVMRANGYVPLGSEAMKDWVRVSSAQQLAQEDQECPLAERQQ